MPFSIDTAFSELHDIESVFILWSKIRHHFRRERWPFVSAQIIEHCIDSGSMRWKIQMVQSTLAVRNSMSLEINIEDQRIRYLSRSESIFAIQSENPLLCPATASKIDRIKRTLISLDKYPILHRHVHLLIPPHGSSIFTNRTPFVGYLFLQCTCTSRMIHVVHITQSEKHVVNEHSRYRNAQSHQGCTL